MGTIFPFVAYPQSLMVGDIKISPEDFSADLDSKKRIEKCTLCHGKSAGGDIDIGPDVHYGTPALRGMSEKYLKESLIAYKNGNRTHNEMSAIAPMLDDETIAFMAKIFATYPPPPAKFASELKALTANDPLFLKGETIAQEGIPQKGVPACITCHGSLGEGTAALGPRLAGQNVMYIESQFKAFADKSRRTPQSVSMQSIVNGLTPDDIKAVAHYYESVAKLD